MKKFYAVVIVIITLIGLCFAQETDNLRKVGARKIRKHTVSMPEMNKGKKIVNLDLNKEVAIKLAEIILENKYGKKVLKQKPWRVSENKDSYKITGSFHGELGAKGGVAEIVISKSDARVLSIIHGK